ncbi:MAG: hypothetical protein ACI3VB_03530 [Oscillospiraceae bacterium]
MTKKRKFVIALGVLLAVALVAGLSTLAATTYGTQSDPLVTLSYLEKTVTPNIMNQLQDSIDNKAAELKAEFDKKLSESGSTTSGFSVISLTSGQTVTCSVGTEIMLRVGTAVSAGADSPRLIDETTGSSVTSAGTSLTKNHMYMVTIQGNGIKATSSVKILIRGDYTIS